MNKLTKIGTIKKLVEDESWFQLDGHVMDFATEDEISFSTRAHGSVSEESHGQKDWDEGERVMLLIMKNYGHYVQAYTLTTCDEWVIIEIKFK